MADKIYIGNGKQGQYSINGSICLSDIPQEHIREYNGKKYVNIKVGARRAPNDKGQTHYIEVDTWKPNGQRTAPDSTQGYTEPSGQQTDMDQLPF